MRLTDNLVDACRPQAFGQRCACGAEIDLGSERLRGEQIVGVSDRQ
jgi:hypothetical protein